jgi:hypothetical protein
MIPDFIIRRLKVERTRIGTILNDISQGSTPEVMNEECSRAMAPVKNKFNLWQRPLLIATKQ